TPPMGVRAVLFRPPVSYQHRSGGGSLPASGRGSTGCGVQLIFSSPGKPALRPDLLTLAASLAARGERFALVTVVRREPPSSARVGDTALVTGAGDYHGWAGGGGPRSPVVREALRAIADGEPRLLSLSPEPKEGQRAGVV